MPHASALFVGMSSLFVVGVALGWLGAGGTAIALPALVYVLGLEPHRAVALSLLLVGASSGLGVWLHGRRGAVRWKAALQFAPFGMAGATLGSRWSYLLSGRGVLLSFSCLLAVIAARILAEKPQADAAHGRHWTGVVMAGFGIGILTGLLGVGGGFLIVPAMIWFAGLGMREAVATSLVVICLNSCAAFAGHVFRQPVDTTLAALLLLAAGAGMTLGVHLSHNTDPRRLKRYFAFLLLGLALFMAMRNL